MSTLTIDQARTIIRVGHEKGTAEGMNPLAILVLDAGGHPMAFERQDGTPFGRFDVAFGKARGALAMGVSSRVLGNMALDRPHFMNGLVGATGGAIVPVPGGVIVTDSDGNHLGAVGISGDSSDNDELCAVAGIEAAGLTAGV
ncbi:MAG: heme-binding protein [Actinomycetia bacterium]|nr:heme-binding protein [Actinomycetes bacterium]MCP4962528.1 heme-binding protein [Actinomycetes bacterium]